MIKNLKIPKQKLLIVFLLFAFLFSVIKIGNAFADTDPFTIKEVTISNKSDTVTVNSLSYEKTKITNDITFHKVGDSLTYQIAIVNNESEDYIIKSLTDNNENEYMTYEYENYEGEILKSKETKTFEVTAKYKNEVTDISKRDQSFKVVFTFTLEGPDGEVKQEDVEMSPDFKLPITGDNVWLYVVTALVSMAMLTVVVKTNNTGKRFKHNKNEKLINTLKIAGLAVVTILLVSTVSRAASESFTITLESTYKLRDKVVVSKTIDGVTTDVVAAYNEVANIEIPSKDNYNFVGWYLEDGTEFDVTKPITDDVKITGKWEDPRSDINITVTDEDEWKPSKTVTITYDVKNISGAENQYSLDNGATWNTYTAPIELNTNNVKVQARTLIKDTNEVIGNAEKTVIKIDPTVPTIAITLGDRYYSGQELDLASVTTTTYGESGATVKWTIEGVEVTNMKDTNKIDKMDSEYQTQVVATITTGAGLTATVTSPTIIIQYVLWDDFLIDGVITRDNIQNIKFGSWTERPTNPTGEKDITYNDTDLVFEYYTLDPDTNLYDIYITSPYGYTRYYNDDMRIYIAANPSDEGTANGSKGLFSYMPNMKTIDFEYMDMYNITNTAHLFDMIDYSTYYWECNSSLTSITWGEKFNTVNVTDMSGMFAGLDELEQIDLNSFNIKNVTSLKSMFARCEKLSEIKLSEWDTSKVESISEMFYATKSLRNLDVSKWNTISLKYMRSTFYDSGVDSLNLKGWNTSKVTDMHALFEFVNAPCNLTSIDLTGWDTSKVTDMGYIFSGFTGTIIGIEGWDTSSVRSFGNAFRGASMPSLDLSKWTTSNAENMEYMFYNYKGDTLDLSGWDTTKVTTTMAMFWASTLKTIDFKNLNLPNDSNLSYMFLQMPNLQNVYVKAMPTYKAGANTTYMWYGSPKNNYTIKEYDD